jgi:hypothetical protein
MFAKILHANDGSEHAFHALSLALAVAKQNNSELHMVSVEEIDYLPEFIEEVREETGTAARRFHGVLQRARAMAEESQCETAYPRRGGASGVRHRQACRRSQCGFARHWSDRPFCIVRADGREPRGSHYATRPVSGASREVTGACRRVLWSTPGRHKT